MPAEGPTEARPEATARGRRRKLAAILSADAVGFSHQMHRDEAGTHARLRSCREIIDRLVAEHDGRVVGSAGDSVLADFPSVAEVDADAEREPVLGRQGGVALAQGLLDADSAGQRLDDAREVGQHAVTRRADDAAVMLGG